LNKFKKSIDGNETKELDAYQINICRIVDLILQEMFGDVPDTVGREIAMFTCCTPGKVPETNVPKRVTCAALSHDNTLFVVGKMDGELELWDVEQWKLLNSWNAQHTTSLDKCDISRDNQHIVSASYSGDVKIWNRSGECLRTRKGNDCGAPSVQFSSNGSRVAVGFGEISEPVVWDWQSDHVLTLRAGLYNANCLALTEDLVFTGVGQTSPPFVRVCDASLGTMIATFKGPEAPENAHKIRPVGCVPLQNQKFLLTLWSNGTVDLWDLGSMTKIRTMHHECPIFDYCISSDERVAFTSDSKNIYACDLITGEIRKVLETRHILGCFLMTKDDRFVLTFGMSKIVERYFNSMEKPDICASLEVYELETRQLHC